MPAPDFARLSLGSIQATLSGGDEGGSAAMTNYLADTVPNLLKRGVETAVDAVV